ncbi:MAG TPA: amidohydrolase family protein, partial [bacterium]|nr:amidohydrolase family protein [bacterium]
MPALPTSSFRALAIAGFLVFGCASPPPAPAEWIFRGPALYTGDGDVPAVHALAVRDGRVVMAGSQEQVAALTGPQTREWTLPEGACLVPGFVDSHAHLFGVGASLRTVDLIGTTSYEEVVQRIVEFSRQHPELEWIRGRGWDQNDWDEKEFPHHGRLSEALPDRPVWVSRVGG